MRGKAVELNHHGKLLSIQSHVVHGYVGNKAATFPLQYKGWDVDALNTVNFSNHPGYGFFKGTKTNSEQIQDLFNGLKEIGCQYDVILTGYVTDASSLQEIHKLCQNYIKDENPSTIWVLDPVLGDNGKLYVSDDILPVYKDMLRQDDSIKLVTPNQFEMELLCGVKIDSLKTLYEAIDIFHQSYKVPNVVVTSVYLNDNKIICCGSAKNESPFYYRVPIIDAKFSGSGDLFSALLTDAFYRYGSQDGGLVKALGETLTNIEKVLKISYEITRVENEHHLQQHQATGLPMYVKDLKIIQAKEVYLENDIAYKVHTDWS